MWASMHPVSPKFLAHTFSDYKCIHRYIKSIIQSDSRDKFKYGHKHLVDIIKLHMYLWVSLVLIQITHFSQHCEIRAHYTEICDGMESTIP